MRTLGHGQLNSKLYVKHGHRRTGLGRAMVAYAEKLCMELDIDELWLTVNRHNTDAIAFYTRVGFATTGKLIQDIGGGFVMDDYRMAKTLDVRGRVADITVTMKYVSPVPAFPTKQLLTQFEGGAVYTAETGGRFYVILDETAMASLLDAEDLEGLQLVKCLEFETSEERSAYIAQRGWRAAP